MMEECGNKEYHNNDNKIYSIINTMSEEKTCTYDKYAEESIETESSNSEKFDEII